jgi:hypothetical protein
MRSFIFEAGVPFNKRGFAGESAWFGARKKVIVSGTIGPRHRARRRRREPSLAGHDRYWDARLGLGDEPGACVPSQGGWLDDVLLDL